MKNIFWLATRGGLSTNPADKTVDYTFDTMESSIDMPTSYLYKIINIFFEEHYGIEQGKVEFYTSVFSHGHGIALAMDTETEPCVNLSQTEESKESEFRIHHFHINCKHENGITSSDDTLEKLNSIAFEHGLNCLFSTKNDNKTHLEIHGYSSSYITTEVIVLILYVYFKKYHNIQSGNVGIPSIGSDSSPGISSARSWEDFLVGFEKRKAN